MIYNIIENIIPTDIVEYLQEYTAEIKQRIKEHEGKPKSNGSGIYWKGLDMASSCDLSSKEENKKLYDIYTSKFMYDIITSYIPTPYLFNDQIVVKEPNEEFSFEPHRDNQYGPFPNDEELLTINCMLVLDDFTKENGAISILDDEWITLYPKVGDVLMIEGNTLHSSKINLSNHSRRAYLCVYSNKSIGKNFQKGFYYEKFVQ
tara:strand:- start:688 stop:1299 length:612 start_codon:yes stop_codon:yes gene_type:complete